MDKSSRQGGMFASRPTGSVTVVQHTIHTNYARNAKVAFYVTLAVVALLTAAVKVPAWHPFVALLLGGAIGAIAGAFVAAVIRVWPIVRMIWWWATEIVCLLLLVWLFTVLSVLESPLLRVGALTLVAGVLLTVGPSRRLLVALAWCVITRHRLRVCFHDVIKSNQHGSLPLILWARPTAVGERVWIFLRPGLSKTDLSNRLERLAVVCWATSVTVEQPGCNAAFLRLDIKRRDVLARTISSPLVTKVDPARPAKPTRPILPLVVDGLDLDAVPTNTTYKPSSAQADKKPAAKPADPSAPRASADPSRKPDPDVSDWI